MSEADNAKEREAKKAKAIAELERIEPEFTKAMRAGDDKTIIENGWHKLLLHAGLLDKALEKELDRLAPSTIEHRQVVENGALVVKPVIVRKRNRSILNELDKMMRDADDDKHKA